MEIVRDLHTHFSFCYECHECQELLLFFVSLPTTQFIVKNMLSFEIYERFKIQRKKRREEKAATKNPYKSKPSQI